MTVKQLYEILGKYVEVGAGEWDVWLWTKPPFKTRKKHREWLKATPRKEFPLFVVGEVIYAPVIEDDADYGSNIAVLCPSFLIKDEKRAIYNLPPEDYVKGVRDTPYANRVELLPKASKISKKRTKKTAKTTKGSKK